MLIDEVAALLLREGYMQPETFIHVAIQNGRISKPPYNSSNQLEFSQEHVEQLRRVLKKPQWRRTT